MTEGVTKEKTLNKQASSVAKKKSTVKKKKIMIFNPKEN